jgi:hypothetical protein
MSTKQFDEAVESEKKLFKSKEYLAKLSKDKNGNNVATKTETLKRILTFKRSNLYVSKLINYT